jgi:hypothetical protein
MPLPVTNAIVITPGDFGDPGLGTQPMATLAGQRIAIDPANAHLAFEAARDAMHANGGSAWVAPSTQPYNIGALVDWGTKPIDLHFSRGARFTQTANVAFRIQGPARIEGLEVLDNWPNSQGRTFLDIDGTAAADVCRDVELVRCLFSMSTTGALVADARCIRARGFSPTQRNGRLVLDDCAFISRAGVQQAWSWVGEEVGGAGTNALVGVPYGVGLLTVENWRDVILTGTVLRGRLPGPGQYSGVGLLFHNVDGLTLDGPVASDLWTVSVGSQAPLIVVRADAGVDAAVSFMGSFCEALDTQNVLAATGNVLLSAVGNQAGRVGGTLVRAAWRAFECEAAVFVDNVAHNISGTLNPYAIDVLGGRAAVLFANAHTLRKNSSPSFQHSGAPTLDRANFSETQSD